MYKITIKNLKILIIPCISIILSSCVMPYLKTVPKDTIDKKSQSDYTFFYRGTLEDPEIILADKPGGLRNIEKFWKKPNPEEINILLLKTDTYESKELIVENNKTTMSEGYIFIPKRVEDEFYYNFSTNVKKGYYLIRKRVYRKFLDGWRGSRFRR